MIGPKWRIAVVLLVTIVLCWGRLVNSIRRRTNRHGEKVVATSRATSRSYDEQAGGADALRRGDLPPLGAEINKEFERLISNFIKNSDEYRNNVFGWIERMKTDEKFDTQHVKKYLAIAAKKRNTVFVELILDAFEDVDACMKDEIVDIFKDDAYSDIQTNLEILNYILAFLSRKNEGQHDALYSCLDSYDPPFEEQVGTAEETPMKALKTNLLAYYDWDFDHFSSCARFWFVVIGYLEEEEYGLRTPVSYVIHSMSQSIWHYWHPSCVIVFTGLQKREIIRNLAQAAQDFKVNDVLLTLIGHGTRYAEGGELERSGFLVDRKELYMQNMRGTKVQDLVLSITDIEQMTRRFEAALTNVESESVPRFVLYIASCFSGGLLVPDLVLDDDKETAQRIAEELDGQATLPPSEAMVGAGDEMQKKRKADRAFEFERVDRHLEQDSSKMEYVMMSSATSDTCSSGEMPWAYYRDENYDEIRSLPLVKDLNTQRGMVDVSAAEGEDVKFERATNLLDASDVKMRFYVQPGSVDGSRKSEVVSTALYARDDTIVFSGFVLTNLKDWKSVTVDDIFSCPVLVAESPLTTHVAGSA